MYAIIKVGGKQQKVAVGTTFKTELENAEVDAKIELPVLMLVDGKNIFTADQVGKSKVVAQVLEHGKEKKLVVFQYKPKKNIRRKQGHRQPFTKLKVIEIRK